VPVSDSSRYTRGGMGDPGRRLLYGGAAVLGAALVLFIVTLASGASVTAGHVGVVSNVGAIDKNQQSLAPGFHLVVPFVTHIDSVSVQPQNHRFSEVAAASRELQNVYVDGGVNYHIDADHAAEIQIEGGLDAIVAKVFDPAFQDYIKEVVPQYTTTDILSHRSQIRDAVKEKLGQKALPFGITVDDVFLTNIHFDEAYTKAIENAAVAQQQLAQAKIDADKARTQAQGEADANRIKQQTITPELIQYQMISKWDGKLPQATGGNPFVSLTPSK
jgi:regulator of protease activity HflC (stomatin/prohibitin superfamily)